MINPQSYRNLFPHIEKGITYLNHAAISPLSKQVTGKIEQYLDMRSWGSIDGFENIIEKTFSTRKKLAHLLGTTPDRLAFVDNTSNGLNIVANGLSWKQGDRILLNTMEFPANVYPFMNLKRYGVEIDFVEPFNNTIPLERLIAAVTPRTRLLSISHVQYLNGYLTDLEEIGTFCREKNIILSVDIIQSAGVVPINVESMRIDFLAGGCYKWLMAPEGSGFVYVTDELQARISQAYVGWTSVSNYVDEMHTFNLELDPAARRYENGMLNNPAIIGLGSSLDLLSEVGIGNIREHTLDLTDHLIAQLEERNITFISPVERSNRSGIVAFRPPDTEALLRAMAGRKVHAAVRGGFVRVSPHFYNTSEEIDTLVSCIDSSMNMEKD
jgi:cysteine desulfurase / selenocysteine lyase